MSDHRSFGRNVETASCVFGPQPGLSLLTNHRHESPHRSVTLATSRTSQLTENKQNVPHEVSHAKTPCGAPEIPKSGE